MIKGAVARFQADVALGNLVGKRIYANIVPINAALPSITYRQIADTPKRYLGGCSLRRTVITWTVHAKTNESAREVLAALRTALGEAGFAGTWDGKTVHLARWDDEADAFVPPQGADDKGRHEIDLDMIVDWQP